MFRGMNTQEHFSKRSSPSTSTSLEEVKDRPASSWISMLAAVSRPTWTFLNKYLPGRTQAWSSEGGKSKMDFGRSLMAGLDNPMPSGSNGPHLSVAYVHCQHKNAVFISEAETQCLTWLRPESLSEFSIQSTSTTTQHSPQVGNGYLKTVRSFLHQIFQKVASTQNEVKESTLEVWYPETRSPSLCWHGYYGSDEQNVPTIFCQTRLSTDTKTDSLHSELYGQASVVVDAKPIELSVHSSGLQCMGCECTRPSGSKGNGSLYTAPSSQSPLGLPLNDKHGVVDQETGTRVASVFCDVASLTPDQDHGYSSLEEEGANLRRSDMNVCEKLEMNSSAASEASDQGHGEERDKPVGTEQYEGENKMEEEQLEEEKVQEENFSELTNVNEVSQIQSTPHCHNKAIAYIMGSPCSDESDWEDSDCDSDDDDGFDSEVSSDFSDSDDLDDEDEDSEDSESEELDPESQRLLNSLCQTGDPYNPRNFMAPIRTSQKPSAAATNFSPLGSPVQSESFLTPADSTSLSPLGTQEIEESSEEACSSMDEAESLTLWNLFSSSSDPYSPLNFRAPIRTREPARKCFKKQTGTQLYRKQEAEERMDSGFSEEASVQCLQSVGCVRQKKVTFLEEVEEFYASSDEERRGPWEEFARDRCRFQRRIQEVEEGIGYCLSPTFRLLTFQRLYSLVSD